MKELFEFLKPILGKLIAKIVAFLIDKWLRKTSKEEVINHVSYHLARFNGGPRSNADLAQATAMDEKVKSLIDDYYTVRKIRDKSDLDASA